MFDIAINCFESLCMFLIVSLLTWRFIDRDILESKYFKQIFILSGILFIVLSNIIQICSFIILSYVLDKIIGSIVFTLILTLIMSGFYSKFKYIHIYILSILVSFISIFLADAIVVMGFSIVYKDILASYSHYESACLISILIKYIILVVTIKVKEPNFFKFSKDSGVRLLASTVTLTAKGGRYTPSWLFFYQAKAPKALDNFGKKNDKAGK